VSSVRYPDGSTFREEQRTTVLRDRRRARRCPQGRPAWVYLSDSVVHGILDDLVWWEDRVAFIIEIAAALDQIEEPR